MLLIEDIVCRRCSKAQTAEIYTLLDRDPGLRSRPPSALRKLETWTSAKQLTFLEKKEPPPQKKNPSQTLCGVGQCLFSKQVL